MLRTRCVLYTYCSPTMLGISSTKRPNQAMQRSALRFAITSPRNAFADETINRRKPGALHHLAFKAESRAVVDRLHRELTGIGATIVSPPREYPEYTPPGYYALFFKDLEGIKYEIVCTTQDRKSVV